MMEQKKQEYAINEKGEIKIHVLEGHAEEIERRYYEMTGLEQLVKQFTSDTSFSVSNEKYKILLADYKEKFAAYNVIWNELITTYVPIELRYKNATFNFNEQCFVLTDPVPCSIHK